MNKFKHILAILLMISLLASCSGTISETEYRELIKEIDHFQYAFNDQLIEFDRAHGTLLAADWQTIRANYPIIDITHSNFQFHIEKSIDALEAIKCKVKHKNLQDEMSSVRG